MDKNEASIKRMFFTTLIVGILIFLGVFATAFGMIDVGEAKFKGMGISLNELTQKELTGAVVSIDLEKEKIELYDYRRKSVIDKKLVFNEYTKFMDQDGNLISNSQIDVGNVVDILYTEKTGIISEIKINPKCWVKKGIVKFNLDKENKIFEVNQKKYEISRDVIYFHGEEKVDKSELDLPVVVNIRGYDDTILAIEIVEYMGSARLIYPESLSGANVAIDSDMIVAIDDVQDVNLRRGVHKFVITKKGINDISLDVEIEENKQIEVEVLDVSAKCGKLKIKTNVSDYTVNVKSSDGAINKTYTDSAATYFDADLMIDETITLPHGSYILTFDKDGKIITKKVIVTDGLKLVSAVFNVKTNVDDSNNTSGGTSTAVSGVTTYKLKIDTVPNDASISINGEEKGKGSINVKVPEGNVVIKVTKAGYQEIERTVEITKNKEYIFTLTQQNAFEAVGD